MPQRSAAERRVSRLLLESGLVFTTYSDEDDDAPFWLLGFDNNVDVVLRLVEDKWVSIEATAKRRPVIDEEDEGLFVSGKGDRRGEHWVHTAVAMRGLSTDELEIAIHSTVGLFGPPRRTQARGRKR